MSVVRCDISRNVRFKMRILGTIHQLKNGSRSHALGFGDESAARYIGEEARQLDAIANITLV